MLLSLSNHRASQRSKTACVTFGVVLSLAGALGCGRGEVLRPVGAPTSSGYELPPILPPVHPIRLASPEERGLGPLRQVAETEVRLVRKPQPAGTVTVERSAFDTDTIVRIADPRQYTDVRRVAHREITRSLQAVGVVDDGFFRFRVQYPRDTSMWLERGEKQTKSSPVVGKTYLLDVGPSGVRALTEKSITPSSEELAVIEEDYSKMGGNPKQEASSDEDAPLRAGARSISSGGEPPPRSPSEVATDLLQKLISDNGFTIEHVSATFMGVRDVEGTPCALFQAKIVAQKQAAMDEKTTWSDLRVGGEYALRLEDGWVAELLVSGVSRSLTQTVNEGVPTSVTTAAFTRIHFQTSYSPPDASAARAVEKLRRAPGEDHP